MANIGSLTQGASGDLQSDIIAQEALKTFSADLGFLGAIHTDFGGAGTRFNQSIQTRIFSARAAADVKDFAQGTGYNQQAAGDADTDADPVEVKLDKHKLIRFHLNDLEREQSEVDLVRGFAQEAAHALAKKVADDLLVAAAAAADTQAAVAVASWDLDDIFTLAEALDNKNAPSDGRWLLMSPQAYYATLGALTTIDNSSYGINAGVTEAQFGRVGGFNIYVYQGTTAALSGGMDLICGTKDSLVMVSRLPEFADASMQLGDISNASEPSSGLSLQLRRKYDVFTAKEEYVLTCLYGVVAPKDAAVNRLIKQVVT